LNNVFLLPKAADKIYVQDNSGERSRPNPGTTVKPHNRVEHLVRISQHQLLLGSGQVSFFNKFYSNATSRLGSLEIGRDWTNLADLMDIFKLALTAASVDSLTGHYLMKRHPTFASDIWAIDDGFDLLFAGLPRFVAKIFLPRTHQARQRAINAVLDWQSWARENFTPGLVDKDGNDPYRGTAFYRDRQEMFYNMDGFDAQAIASEELSFIWL
jgi:hypothetical protein